MYNDVRTWKYKFFIFLERNCCSDEIQENLGQVRFTEVDTLCYHVEGVTRLIVSALIDIKLIIDDYYNGIIDLIDKKGGSNYHSS